MKKAEEKIEIPHEATRKMEEAMNKVLEENMQMELHLADVSYEHKINADATRMKMEEAMNKVLAKEKMQVEVQLANVIHEHKINDDATRMKMRKIKRYALGKEICLHYAIDAIVILVAIFIPMSGFFRCMR